MIDFNTLKECSISEEILGAYLEGNLSECEKQEVEYALTNDSELQSFINEIQNINIDWEQSYADSYEMEDVDFDLPIIQTIETSLVSDNDTLSTFKNVELNEIIHDESDIFIPSADSIIETDFYDCNSIDEDELNIQ